MPPGFLHLPNITTDSCKVSCQQHTLLSLRQQFSQVVVLPLILKSECSPLTGIHVCVRVSGKARMKAWEGHGIFFWEEFCLIL